MSNIDKATAKMLCLVTDLIQKLFNVVISIDELFSFLNMPQSKRKELFGIKTILSFLIGGVFKHRDDSTKVRQYFGDNFKAWLWNPSQTKTITVPSSMEKLKEYVLPTNMDDTTIRKNNSSTSVDENTFWILLYCLIIEPQLGKELLGYECKKDGTVYIIHVKLADGKVVAFRLYWDVGAWFLGAHSFGNGFDWHQGRVFLYFATRS